LEKQKKQSLIYFLLLSIKHLWFFFKTLMRRSAKWLLLKSRKLRALSLWLPKMSLLFIWCIAIMEDIELAFEGCRRSGNHDIELLKCTSNYLISIQEANMAM
jgi:hypothetical protein